MREPSGETCGSPIQTKLKRSFSVILRFWASAGAAREKTIRTSRDTRTRKMGRMLEIPFERGGNAARVLYYLTAKTGSKISITPCTTLSNDLMSLTDPAAHLSC